MTQVAKHYRAEELIKAGGATLATLMGELEVDQKGLASQFYYMRLRGLFPVKDAETGVFSIMDKETYEAQQADKMANRKPTKVLTPEERLEAAQKRVNKAAKAIETTEARNDKSPSTKNELLWQRAVIESKLADLELEEAQNA